MRLLPFILLVCALAQGERETFTIFGIKASWESNSPDTQREISREVARISQEGAQYYDPDGLYPKEHAERLKATFPEKVRRLTDISEQFRNETLGYFDIHHRNGPQQRRDFGGLWQGDAIDELRATIDGSFIIDFSGDIFITDPSIQRQIILTDPLFDSVEWATIRLNRGYAMTSVSKRLRGSVRTPDKVQKSSSKGEILKVVLFARPSFSGARLDAWSTAVIAGGTKVLNHLAELEEFKGQWEYFYFEANGTPHCSHSERISCRFDTDPKVIELQL